MAASHSQSASGLSAETPSLAKIRLFFPILRKIPGLKNALKCHLSQALVILYCATFSCLLPCRVLFPLLGMLFLGSLVS